MSEFNVIPSNKVGLLCFLAIHVGLGMPNGGVVRTLPALATPRN